jgi:pyruvate formate lyase activating enzyme
MTAHYGIKGFIPSSLIDWPGKVCSIIFLARCGFRCPTCHNKSLVTNSDSIPEYPLDEILQSLRERKDWIDGLTVTGGEPTIRRNLPDFLTLFRTLALRIKLDTNGSNPNMLERLIERGLIDAVYMDVKAPLTNEAYSAVAGVSVDVRVINRSITLLKQSGLEVAFRTTVIPGLVEEAQVESIKESLGEVRRYIIQAFRNGQTLNPRFEGIAHFDQGRIDKMRRRFEVPARVSGMPNQYAYAGWL